MDSWIRGVAAVVGSVLVLAVTACVPTGMDGDLTSDWAALPEPRQMVPEAGLCYTSYYNPTLRLRSSAPPTDCTSTHELEVAHVGTFSGEAAARDTPPTPETPAWRDAYAECEREAADYLGADFRHGWLWLGVAVPTQAAWGGGARWFRCDLTEVRERLHRMLWPDSLRGALAAGPSDLTLNCFTATVEDSGDVSGMDPVPCSEPHQAEFAGVWRSEQAGYPRTEGQINQVHRGCRGVVAEFIDVSEAELNDLRFGHIFDWVDELDWNNGDRGFRCYLYSHLRDLTRSMAGVGPQG